MGPQSDARTTSCAQNRYECEHAPTSATPNPTSPTNHRLSATKAVDGNRPRLSRAQPPGSPAAGPPIRHQPHPARGKHRGGYPVPTHCVPRWGLSTHRPQRLRRSAPEPEMRKPHDYNALGPNTMNRHPPVRPTGTPGALLPARSPGRPSDGSPGVGRAGKTAARCGRPLSGGSFGTGSRMTDRWPALREPDAEGNVWNRGAGFVFATPRSARHPTAAVIGPPPRVDSRAVPIPVSDWNRPPPTRR